MSDNRQLLVDYVPFDVSPSMINESLEKNNGRILITGVLQRANSKNQNGRIYPKEILSREVKRYLQEFVDQKRALGELDHPDSSVVNLSNVSHNIVEMHWTNDDLIGTLEILGTPSGNILKELLKSGIRIGISSRGLGSVKESAEGANQVQDDFELIAFDTVSNPSTQGAFMKSLHESVNKKSSKKSDKYDKIQEIITEILVDMEK